LANLVAKPVIESSYACGELKATSELYGVKMVLMKVQKTEKPFGKATIDPNLWRKYDTVQ